MGEEEGISGRGRGREGAKKVVERIRPVGPLPRSFPEAVRVGQLWGFGGLSWPHLEPRGPGKSSGGDNGAVSVGE